MASELSPTCTKCKIIIVGGGMAGLSAATLLSKNKMTDFKLLEARNRIGGRIVSIEKGKTQTFQYFYQWFGIIYPSVIVLTTINS